MWLHNGCLRLDSVPCRGGLHVTETKCQCFLQQRQLGNSRFEKKTNPPPPPPPKSKTPVLRTKSLLQQENSLWTGFTGNFVPSPNATLVLRASGTTAPLVVDGCVTFSGTLTVTVPSEALALQSSVPVIQFPSGYCGGTPTTFSSVNVTVAGLRDCEKATAQPVYGPILLSVAFSVDSRYGITLVSRLQNPTNVVLCVSACSGKCFRLSNMDAWTCSGSCISRRDCDYCCRLRVPRSSDSQLCDHASHSKN